MTLAGFPRIAIDPAVCGGRPIIAGTRMRVSDIWEMLASGGSIAEIIEDFPYLCEADVQDAKALASLMLGHPELLEYDHLLRRDRQAIRTENLDSEALKVILVGKPGERSNEAGQRIDDPGTN